MKKRFFSLLLAAILIVTALPAAAFAAQSAGLSNFAKTNTYADGKFTDVKADDWFEKNVSAAYELNLMVGKGDDFFDTENNLTVAEAMTIAARLRSIYYTGKAEFEQGEPWYQVYANYCKINGVADPADYDMNKAVTRGEFAEIFAKAFPSDALKKINTVHDNMIPDVKKADKFSAAIYLLYRAGILVGNDSKGTFAPDTNIKRAEAAAITTRMADSSLREKISLVDPTYDDWYYVPATPTTYTVSFDMQGHGTTPTNLSVKEGNTIKNLPEPTATDLVFGGWYKDASCTDLWATATDLVTQDITLYAKWTAMPSKGDIITLNNDSEHAYRVLSVEGSKAFVVSMYNVAESAIAYDADKTMSEKDLIKYAGSDIDNYLENTWYAGLDSTMKGAIKKTTIDQPAYNQALEQPSGTEGEDYYKVTYGGSLIEYIVPQSDMTVPVGKRHVYLLDVMDVVNYLGTENLTAAKVNKTFFNNESTTSTWCWLRSSTAETGCTAYAWDINGMVGKFDIMPGDNSWSNAVEARAAFTIDLSKVDFDIVPELYTVTFDMNGVDGIAPTAQTVAKGGKVTKPVDPTDTVHTFAGWYKDSGYTTEWDFDTDTVTADVTLYAQWTRRIVNIIQTVDFPMNTSGIPTNAWVDSSKPNNKVYAQKYPFFNILYVDVPSQTDSLQLVYFGESTSDNVEKIGNSYTWRNDYSHCTITFNLVDDVLANIKIEAMNGADKSVQDAAGTYVAPTYYTVSFDMQGYGTTPTNLPVNEGEKITKPADPTATDLVFVGWYTEASCTNLWDFANDKVTDDITLYAKWTGITFKEIGGVKWATKNLGAEKETDYGDYFAWGETAPYYEGTGGRPATPTWKSGKESGYAWQSYCAQSSFSEWSPLPYDATTKILNPEFDAATALLGSGWRMPTSAEFQALYDACLNGSFDTTTNPSGASASVGKGVYWCTSYDGVAGCLFCDGTNKLFFPAAGYGNGNGLSNSGSYGYYWSSTLSSDINCAWRMYFYNTGVNPQGYTWRYCGNSVRPVVKEE